MCKTCGDGAKAELENTDRIRGCGVDGRPLDQSHPGINDGGEFPEIGPPDYRCPNFMRAVAKFRPGVKAR